MICTLFYIILHSISFTFLDHAMYLSFISSIFAISLSSATTCSSRVFTPGAKLSKNQLSFFSSIDADCILDEVQSAFRIGTSVFCQEIFFFHFNIHRSLLEFKNCHGLKVNRFASMSLHVHSMAFYGLNRSPNSRLSGQEVDCETPRSEKKRYRSPDTALLYRRNCFDLCKQN